MKKITAIICSVFITLLCFLPVFAETMETNNYSACSLAIYGYVDSTINKDASIVLTMRNCENGQEYISELSGVNGFFDLLTIKDPGEFEIYDGYIVAPEGNNRAANIEYVRFKCGDSISSAISIVIGDINDIDGTPEPGARINPVGKAYSSYPTNINRLIEVTNNGETETEIRSEPVTASKIYYSNIAETEKPVTKDNTSDNESTEQRNEENSNSRIAIISIIAAAIVLVTLLLVCLKFRKER